MKLEFPHGALRAIGATQMDEAQRLAGESSRARALLRYHEHEESVQRMVHAVEPATYVRPHKHERPDKVEIFLALRGAAAICRWSERGELCERIEIRAGGPQHGVEIPPRVWHSLVALEPGTVLYEVIEGAYDPASHKHYANWAPEEGSAEATDFQVRLRERLGLAVD